MNIDKSLAKLACAGGDNDDKKEVISKKIYKSLNKTLIEFFLQSSERKCNNLSNLNNSQMSNLLQNADQILIEDSMQNFITSSMKPETNLPFSNSHNINIPTKENFNLNLDLTKNKNMHNTNSIDSKPTIDSNNRMMDNKENYSNSEYNYMRQRGSEKDYGYKNEKSSRNRQKSKKKLNSISIMIN